MKTLVWIIVAVVVIGGGWYLLSMGQSQQSPTAQVQTTNTQPAAPAPTTTQPAPSSVSVLSVHSDPTNGTYLVAANGMTLYIDTKDSAGVSTCSGVCAANWPAYTVSSTATLTGGAGVTGAIGIIKGTSQLTYKGMPLYFWVKDTKAGDATGNNIGNFVFAKP